MENSKAVVEIIAPNTRTYNMLEFVLHQHGKGRFELGRGNRPDLVVVDFDNSDVKSAFRKYRSRFPGIPAILLLNLHAEYETLYPEDRIGAEFLLLKPFAVRDFIAKIDECLGGAQSQPAAIEATGPATAVAVKSRSSASAASDGKQPPQAQRNKAIQPESTLPLQISSTGKHAVRLLTRPRNWGALENENIAYSFALESDINMADDAAVKKICLRTDDKLLGHFQSVVSQQKFARNAICLSVRDGVSFHISPYAATVAVVGRKFDLQELARRDFASGEISVSESAMPDKGVLLQLEQEAFLWKLALYTYRGYLPEGIDINRPVYLKYWPNLTRLEPTPDAMRIAALLCRQPVALAFVVRILNIPQRHVFNFFSAAHAIGYSGQAVREVDNLLLPTYPDELGALPVQGRGGRPLAGDKKDT